MSNCFKGAGGSVIPAKAGIQNSWTPAFAPDRGPELAGVTIPNTLPYLRHGVLGRRMPTSIRTERIDRVVNDLTEITHTHLEGKS